MSNNLKYAPSSRTPYLNPGTIQSHHNLATKLLFPPIIVNLREDRNPADPCSRDVLTVRELNYFKNNGNNATIFIHGFNVPYGEFSKQIDTLTVPQSLIRQRPNLPRVKFSNTDCTVYREIEVLKQSFPVLGAPDTDLSKPLQEENINGSGTHSWYLAMEDNLNRATGQFDRTDYSKYSRIINVAWSGDVAIYNYIEAETYANQAGFGVAKLIDQLVSEGIAVNVIAHSLGNRVLLVAMNILGQMSNRRECIRNAFLWQPAVPDTALSNDPSKDTSVLRNWNFIHAHLAAKTIVVLYSNRDNVLGEHPDDSSFHEDFDGEGGLKEALGGKIGSAYGIATNIGVPGEEYITKPFKLKALKIRNYYKDNWAAFENAMKNQIAMDSNGLFTDHLKPQWPEKSLPIIGPWFYTRRITREMGEDAIKTVKAFVEADFEVKKPRPAMGYSGPEMVEDRFVRDMRDKGKLIPVDQKLWLFSHSGMKLPSALLLEKVYEERIMQRLLRDTGFGRY